MFKKTLVAVAALGAFGSAMAANVTLYGVVDEGLVYSHVNNGAARTDSWSLNSGNYFGSRFGLKGEEELGNGVSVGFVLENGFSADTGSLGFGGRLFGRECMAYLKSGYGKLGFGRMGELASAFGSFGQLGYNVGPFVTGSTDDWAGAGHSVVLGGNFARLDNTVTYQTPSMAGLQLTAQYSMNADGTDKTAADNKKSAKRQAAAAARYKIGGLDAVVVYTYNQPTLTDDKKGQNVVLGGNYNFGVAKATLVAGWWDNAALNKKMLIANYAKAAKTEGYGVNLGVEVPFGSLKAKAAVGYMDAETETGSKDITRYLGAVGAEYVLTKRTGFYGIATYMNDKFDGVKGHSYGAAVGMYHRF